LCSGKISTKYLPARIAAPSGPGFLLAWERDNKVYYINGNLNQSID